MPGDGERAVGRAAAAGGPLGLDSGTGEGDDGGPHPEDPAADNAVPLSPSVPVAPLEAAVRAVPMRHTRTTFCAPDHFAAVRDAYCGRLCDMEGIPGLADHPELQPQASYLNSGVLLIDVRRWLAHDITATCLDYARRYAAQTRFLDQDSLNVALHGTWLRVAKTWNHMLGSRLESSFGGSLAEARLIHHIGPDKLWDDRTPGGDRKALYKAYARKAEAAIDGSGDADGGVPVAGAVAADRAS